MNEIIFKSDPEIIERLDRLISLMEMNLNIDQEEKYYSIKDAAPKLGMSEGQARKLAKDGTIRTIDKGTGKNRFLMISAGAIEEYRDSRSSA